MNNFFHAQNVNEEPFIPIRTYAELIEMISNPIRNGNYVLQNDIIGVQFSVPGAIRTVPYRFKGQGYRVALIPEITKNTGTQVRYVRRSSYFGNATISGVNFECLLHIVAASLTDCGINWNGALMDKTMNDLFGTEGIYYYSSSYSVFAYTGSMTRCTFKNYRLLEGTY